jgi:hypothetical protein
MLSRSMFALLLCVSAHALSLPQDPLSRFAQPDSRIAIGQLVTATDDRRFAKAWELRLLRDTAHEWDATSILPLTGSVRRGQIVEVAVWCRPNGTGTDDLFWYLRIQDRLSPFKRYAQIELKPTPVWSEQRVTLVIEADSATQPIGLAIQCGIRAATVQFANLRLTIKSGTSARSAP